MDGRSFWLQNATDTGSGIEQVQPGITVGRSRERPLDLASEIDQLSAQHRLNVRLVRRVGQGADRASPGGRAGWRVDLAGQVDEIALLERPPLRAERYPRSGKLAPDAMANITEHLVEWIGGRGVHRGVFAQPRQSSILEQCREKSRLNRGYAQQRSGWLQPAGDAFVEQEGRRLERVPVQELDRCNLPRP